MLETLSTLQGSKTTSIAPTCLGRHYIILTKMQQAMQAQFLPVRSRSDTPSACKTLANLYSAYLAQGSFHHRLVSPEASWQSKSTSQTGLTRSQLAEQKHIRRQSSISDSQSSQSRSMSVERSRPSSASLCSTRESLSREPSSRRLASTDRSQSGAAEFSSYGGSGYRHSTSRSASRPASPGQTSSHTIPAYNPSFGRSTVTSSNSKLPSTAASRQSLGSASFRLTEPDASLRRSSTSNISASHPYATQASHSWRAPQSTVNKQSNCSAGDSKSQYFLSTMEKKKAEAAVSSLHSHPRRSNSNPKAFLELGGQLVSSSMASLGDKLRRWDAPLETLPL